jgi:hypothetical protein
MRYKADYQPSELLCPTHYEWVDVTKAQQKLRATPHHVCPLVEKQHIVQQEEEEEENDNDKNDNDNTTTNPTTLAQEHPCPYDNNHNHSPKHKHSKTTSAAAILSTIQMDIGVGMPVTCDMLQPNGQRVVQPILEELVQEAGPDLCRHVLVKLS